MLHHLCRDACQDDVRLVEPLGDDTPPSHNAVVGNAHVLADLDILAHPDMTADLDAFGVIDRPSRGSLLNAVGRRTAIHPFIGFGEV